MSSEKAQLKSVYRGMLERCYNPKHKYYERYGGRGIKVCEEWEESFEAFCADMGERPKGHDLDRIDNDKGYSPDNCRWAGHRENCNNRVDTKLITLTSTGETLPLSYAAERLNIPYISFYNKLYYNDRIGKTSAYSDEVTWEPGLFTKAYAPKSEGSKWKTTRKTRLSKRHLKYKGDLYSIAEIASMLEVKAGSVKSWIYNYRKKGKPLPHNIELIDNVDKL